MSNVSDNLPAFYVWDVIFICCFVKGFVLPFQKATFTSYFTLGFFL